MFFRAKMIRVSGIEYWPCLVSIGCPTDSHATLQLSTSHQQHHIPQTPACISTESHGYIIVPHPSVRWPSGNEVGPYRRDQSTSIADRQRGRGTANCQSLTGRRRCSPSSLRRELQMAAVLLQWGSSWVSSQQACWSATKFISVFFCVSFTPNRHLLCRIWLWKWFGGCGKWFFSS